VHDVLASVLATLEDEITPAVTDDYAASLCKTSAALLRHCISRVELEGAFLDGNNRTLREILIELAAVFGDHPASQTVHAALSGNGGHDGDGRPRNVDAAELLHEADRLHDALAAGLEALAETDSAAAAAIHSKIRGYLAQHLAAQAPWLVEPFVGEVR
jgi:hypothetical protein